MPLSLKAVWTPFCFSIALSTICVVANLTGYASTGNPTVGLRPFFGFLPMVFFFAAMSQKQALDHIVILEQRIQLLEGRNTGS